ncbi:hypothetical protein FOL47_009189 [Perkinsus chesapeaki]|uniref:Cytochrome b5 heme-binding domain-containing protein n=1 Tax=Perkinsus chesapeaki TaxID=330153 RepID=A0A7J6LA95_PERCH|nr:hypothetical protein FOL47_009189 [Perkinsus chesapeaki]
MSEYPSSPSPNIPEEGICVSDSEAEQIQRSHPTHVSFADRVKHEIALNEDGSNTASKGGSHLTPAAPQAKRMRTPVQRTTPPQSRRKVKSKNQFAYMRIMADNKPVSYPPDKLTWDEVSRHNSRHDCWTVVNGIVYDITSYLDYHPGGKGELMQGAGKDCTELFNAYHPWVSEAAILRNARLGPVVGGHCPPEMVAKSHDKLPVNATNIPGVMRPGGDPTKIVSMTVPPLEEPALPSIPERSTLKPASGTVTTKIGDEAFGQGIANVAMALAKLRYEDSSFMDTLAGIISGSVRSFTLVDIGQIAFAFGKLHLAASSSSEKISTMFGYIADRVADDGVEESLSDNLPAACSLLYGMHRLGLECQEFSDLIAAKLLPHVNLLGPNKLLLILPACRNLSNTVKASSGMSTSSDALYRSAGKAFAEKAASLSMGLLIQGLTCVHPYDLEDISQQLRHRGNATWIYHARYGVSILQALVNNFTALDDKMTLVPGPETCELVREICHHLGNDDRLFGQLDSDQKKVLLALPQLSYFTHLGALQKVLASPIV